MTKLIKNRRANLFRMFSLRDDLDDLDEIDANIRSGVEIFGTNLWVLIFAILIASVGLNMNSTPVIIGAMLISPLMGPIIGMGYGLAINDMAFVRKALSSFAIFTAISLITSIVYFYISPLKEPGSELLARTSPTLWDVLIAFFGGAAGIIAITRRGISNVVPGMAIATALMPPLCTAGYSIARGKWEWMGNLEFHYDKDHHQWRADFKNSRVSVRWEFDAEKDRMTGVLRQFPEDVVVRKIQVRRISAR